MSGREYDVVIYGASGFTGAQAAAYLAERLAPPTNLRWAIAGRNRRKLEAVKESLGAAAGHVPVLIADSQDQAAVDAIVSRTAVLLSTAGPFALHGNCLVDACVRCRTHYVDITGETLWIKQLIQKYHARAAAAGTRIVPACGFDSVPSDLGAYLVVRHMRSRMQVQGQAVQAYFRVQGGINGGTLATLYHVLAAAERQQLRDPFLLDADHSPHSPQAILASKDPVLPHYDSGLCTWVGPFFMGPINTRVVRRSESLARAWGDSYGPEFRYQEYLRFDGPWAGMRAWGMTLGAAAFLLALRSPLSGWIKRRLPQPGQGPDRDARTAGWYRCDLRGITVDGREVRGLLCDRGDPGNCATSKFLCESALCLALQFSELPGGSERGGVLTPATAFGDVLLERLKRAGVTVEVQEA